MRITAAEAIHLFIGKGGVGKSTVSALTALGSAAGGTDTLLVSMDPAHNQEDIFDRPLGSRPVRIQPDLQACQVDVGRWTERYLKESIRHLQQTYRYQSAFNLDHCFRILRLSPGLEELALLLAFEDLVEKHAGRRRLVFDMPPTALALRFLSLPFVSRLWLEELRKLRRRIQEQREIVSRIRWKNKEIEQDRVSARLDRLMGRYDRLSGRFRDAVRVNLVVNPEPLSVAEGLRTRATLREIGMEVDRLIINKLPFDQPADRIGRRFGRMPATVFPLSSAGLQDRRALESYLKAHPHILPPPAFGGGVDPGGRLVHPQPCS